MALHDAAPSSVAVMQGHTAPVTCLALTGDGASVIAGAEDGSARVFEAGSRQVVRVFDNPARGALTGVLVTVRRPSMVPGTVVDTLWWWCTTSLLHTGSVRKAPSRPQPLAALCKYEGMGGVLGPHEDAVVLLAGGEAESRGVEEPAQHASAATREVEALQQRLQRAMQAGMAWKRTVAELTTGNIAKR